MIYFDLCFLCTLLMCMSFPCGNCWMLRRYVSITALPTDLFHNEDAKIYIYFFDIRAFKSVCMLLKILHSHAVKSQGWLLSNKSLFNLIFRLGMSQRFFFSYPYFSIAVKIISCHIFVFLSLEVVVTNFLPLHFAVLL